MWYYPGGDPSRRRHAVWDMKDVILFTTLLSMSILMILREKGKSPGFQRLLTIVSIVGSGWLVYLLLTKPL